MTYAINDPLGQTHIHAISDHCFVLRDFESGDGHDGRMDGRTDNI